MPQLAPANARRGGDTNRISQVTEFSDVFSAFAKSLSSMFESLGGNLLSVYTHESILP